MLHATEIAEWRQDFNYIRGMSIADVPWFIDLCRRRYPPRSDKIRTEDWIRNRVLTNPATYLAMRASSAACITVMSTPVWYPADWEAQVAIVIADTGAMWQAIRLLRISRDWARLRDCVAWRIGNATEHDIGALARRVGAIAEPTRYQITWPRS
jgi:hypothetical protein